ncbi:stalk domain-containing protein [Halobacillus litoralis]|uniref:stalk domain-containing protein n=1 Tax=Halobacillus litoralis TaxID=45668 RepID=UPI001CFC5A45|nr:stalk domain-containing protein [Halobacillus litoralis]
MKPVIKSISLLMCLSLLLVIYWWNTAQASGSDRVSLSADASVNIHEGIVEVDFTYHGLAPGIYDVTFPTGTSEVSCSFDTATTCWMTEDQLNYEGGGSVHISYHLPVPEQTLVDSWRITLVKDGKEILIPYTLTIQNFTKEEWKAPIQKQSDIQLENVHYQTYKKTVDAAPLLSASGKEMWQDKKSVITYKKDQPLSESVKQDLQQFLSAAGPSVVELDSKKVRIEDGYMTTMDRNVDALESKWITTHLENASSVNQPWHTSVIQEVFYPRSSSNASSYMADEIRDALTAEQLEAWKVKLLKSTNIKSLSQFLDQTLTDVYGLGTTFFQSRTKPERTPLIFIYDQPLHLDGVLVEGQVLSYRHKDYYPIKNLVQAAGFTFTALEHGQRYRVETNRNTYRFYVDQSTFIVNEESFGIGTNPVILFDDQVYLKEQYVDDLLGLTRVDGVSFSFQKK